MSLKNQNYKIQRLPISASVLALAPILGQAAPLLHPCTDTSHLRAPSISYAPSSPEQSQVLLQAPLCSPSSQVKTSLVQALSQQLNNLALNSSSVT